MKLILLAVAMLTAAPGQEAKSPPAPPPSTMPVGPSQFYVDFALIERVDCDEGRGTGSWIAADRILTAAHVFAAGNCTVRGLPTRPIFVDNDRDVAVLETQARSKTAMEINCDGSAPGAHYLAIGYAFGLPRPVLQQLKGSRFNMSGFSTLKGHIYPGMSGGPVVNDDGEIVAIVDMQPRIGTALAYVRSLGSTMLCGAV